MKFDSDRALALLRLGTGDREATFRGSQQSAIRYVVEGKGRLLVVQRTGWGKSFVYFIATKLMREAGAGPVLLISPLLALMRNQILAATAMGLVAETINSSNADDWESVVERMRVDEVDILLISPERLANDYFQEKVIGRVASDISALVVDEAHCISDWGHDFRPHYRLIDRFASQLPGNTRLLATTATANDRVLSDLARVLGPNLQISRGDLTRSSLTLQTIRLDQPAERLAWLADRLAGLSGSGIIYTLTIRDAHVVAAWLKKNGFDVEAYTGESGDDRQSLEQSLLDNRIKALVATTALGMGFDKPDLAFVIHYQTPGSVVSYYQQVGRAGRGLDKAYCVLLSGEEDTKITGYFINSAFPSEEEVAEVIRALEEEPDGLSVAALQNAVNIRQGRIAKTLQLLSLESPAPIVKEGSKWQLTSSDLSQGFWDRAGRLKTVRFEEQQQMEEYVNLRFGQHMRFLVEALDGDAENCECNPQRPLSGSIEPQLVQDALAFLRRTSMPIDPRRQWPAGGMEEHGVKGRITEDEQNGQGRALSMLGDGGWSSLVRTGKFDDNHFSDELVEACADMYRQWHPRPGAQWVTCIPSSRHPKLVPDFAKRLANSLGLPFKEVLVRVEDRPEQRSMVNSAFQARNVDGAFAVSSGKLHSTPVLLIDDAVVSRWTLTIAGWLLRSHGSGKVWPMVLTQLNGDD